MASPPPNPKGATVNAYRFVSTAVLLVLAVLLFAWVADILASVTAGLGI